MNAYRPNTSPNANPTADPIANPAAVASSVIDRCSQSVPETVHCQSLANTFDGDDTNSGSISVPEAACQNARNATPNTTWQTQISRLRRTSPASNSRTACVRVPAPSPTARL